MAVKNIYQKLLEVRKSVPYLQKEAKSQQYNYVSSSQVIGAVRQKLDEVGLVLTTEIVGKTLVARERTNAKNVLVINYEYDLDLKMTWVNAENPEEKVVIPWSTSGLDTGDNAKAIGKALTYGEKYFLLKQFSIATDHDDADRFHEKAEGNVRDLATDEQVDNLVTLCTEYAEMVGRKVEEVYGVLNIKSVDNLTPQQIIASISQVEAYIKKQKEKNTKPVA